MLGVEYKTVGVNDVRYLEDHGDGRITAYVSVTGVQDNVNDVIHPGAYTETLKKRLPKGVWSHDWTRPVSKTHSAVELPPGHPDLPKTLSNGMPWPKEAGAVKVDMEFNTSAPRGFQAYKDVQFFGNQQEWSIGYKVPSDGATFDKKTGVRHIHKLDWYEYSPVLFGAMPHARTKLDPTVEEMQLAFKSLAFGVDITPIVLELKKWRDEHGYGALLEMKDDAGSDFVGDTPPDFEEKDYGGEDPDDDDYLDAEEFDEDEEDGDEQIDDGVDEGDGDIEDPDDEGDDGEGDPEGDGGDDEEYNDTMAGKGNPNVIRDAIGYLEELEGKLDLRGDAVEVSPEVAEGAILFAEGKTAYLEAKATGYDNVCDAVGDIQVPMSRTDEMALTAAATAFDTAVKSEDQPGAEQAATEIIDILEVLVKGSGGEDAESAQTVARVVSDMLYKMDDEDPEEDATSDEEGGGDEEYKSYFNEAGIESKNYPFADREFGFPKEVAEQVSVIGEDGIKAFIGGLDNDVLETLHGYLEVTDIDDGVKALVDDEIEIREMAGEMEFKRHVRKMSAFWEVRGYALGDEIGKPSGKKPAAAKKATKPRGAVKRGGGFSAGRPDVRKGPVVHRTPALTPGSGSNRSPVGTRIDVAHGHVMKVGPKRYTAHDARGRLITDSEGNGEHNTVRSAAAFVEDHHNHGNRLPRTIGKRPSPADLVNEKNKVTNSSDIGHVSETDYGRVTHMGGGAHMAHTHLGTRVGDIHPTKAHAERALEDHYHEFDAANPRGEDGVRRPAGHHLRDTDPDLVKMLHGRLDATRDNTDADEMMKRYSNARLNALIAHDESTHSSPGFAGYHLTREYIRRRAEDKKRGGFDAAGTAAKLRAAPTRRDAWGHVAGLSGAQLHQVSDELGIDKRLRGRNKTEHSNVIVEMSAGSRLDSAAIRGVARGGSALALSGDEPGANETSPMSGGRVRRMMDRLRRKADELGVEFKAVGPQSGADLDTAKREKYAKSGIAMPDGSYPIPNLTLLKKAIKAIGRAKDKDAAMAHIKDRAKKLNAEYLLPADWTAKKAAVDITEMKSLEDFLASVKTDTAS